MRIISLISLSLTAIFLWSGLALASPQTDANELVKNTYEFHLDVLDLNLMLQIHYFPIPTLFHQFLHKHKILFPLKVLFCFSLCCYFVSAFGLLLVVLLLLLLLLLLLFLLPLGPFCATLPANAPR